MFISQVVSGFMLNKYFNELKRFGCYHKYLIKKTLISYI